MLERSAKTTDATGETLTYTYDKDGNQTNITVTRNNNQIINQTASYNYVGDMTSVYDNKEEKTIANYSYDGNGNMIEKKTADGMHKTVYDYNESNLLTKVENMTIYNKETNQFGSYSSYEYEYYLDGNRSKETENTGKNKEYTYDGAGRLKTERYDETGGLSSWANKYEYDARGNRAVKEIVEGTKEIVDDFVEETDIYTATTLSSLPELTSWAGYATTYYTYDNNNRLTFEKWYDEAYMNRESSYTYDNNGNLKSEHTETWYDNFAPEDPTVIHYPDDDISYSYNGMNQLIEVERNGEEYNYVYDGKGQRVKKTLNGKTIEYVWDGSGNIIGENEKVYSRGAGGEIVSDGENYYAYNGHGDTTNLVQMSSGTSIALTATYEYDAFGNAQITGNESAGNPFRYNGQYTDDETGLIYLRNRYYDPSIGRFTQEDPYWNVNNMIYGEDGSEEDEIKIPDYSSIIQSTNLYLYCIGEPVNGMDPYGLRLVLRGTGDEVQTIWKNIKEFSQDALVLTQEVDSNGMLLDSYVVTVAEERTGGCDMGSILVRRIAYSDVTIDVKIWDGDNRYIYDTHTVLFNPNFDPYVLTVNPYDGSGYYDKRPAFIGLAHELIHADRDIRNVTLSGSSKYTYTSSERSFWTGNYKVESDYARNEELATIGIMYNDGYWDITENDIRAEHGLWLRGAYNV